MDFQKKLQSLTATRKITLQNQTDFENKLAIGMQDRIQKNIRVFESLKGSIKEFCGKIEEAIKENGDSILIYTNEDSSNLQDSARQFINVYVYPKGFTVQRYGYSAAGVFIECFPNEGTLEVKKKILSGSSQISVVEDNLKVSTVPIEHITDLLLNVLGEIFISHT